MPFLVRTVPGKGRCVISVGQTLAGEVVMRDSAVAHVVVSNLRDAVCDTCLTPSSW